MYRTAEVLGVVRGLGVVFVSLRLRRLLAAVGRLSRLIMYLQLYFLRFFYKVEMTPNNL